MKKLIYYSACICLLVATSCSRNFENKEEAYEANVKGFFNSNDEDGTPQFTILTIEKVINDWDGGGDNPAYEAKESTDKLIKVEIRGTTTHHSLNLGITEANLELFDSKSKKTYAPLISLSNGVTFKGTADRSVSGYVVYSIPTEANPDDLYIGINKEMATSDLSKVELSTLLPLKKNEALKESTVAINQTKVVHDGIFELDKTYIFGDLTYNCTDEAVSKYKEENYDDPSESFIKLEIEVKNSSSSNKAFVTEPYLVTEYGIVSKSYSMGEFPSPLEPNGTFKTSLYYQVPVGAKVSGFIGEGLSGDDYSIELNK